LHPVQVGRRLAVLGAAGLVALVPTSAAATCVCAELPLRERFDAADAAVVGRVVAARAGESKGAPVRLLTVEVDQRVKGRVDRTLVVSTPARSDCELVVPRGRQTGLLLTRSPGGGWVATACSVVAPGPLVAEGGEPRGTTVKIGIGLLILVLVLLWSLRRLKKGARPDLPGAPGP
jgi:hypothetical protein